MSLYEQLCKSRKRVLISDTSSKSRDEKMKVLSQLMNLAFNNRQKPDELPQVFRIQNIDFLNSLLLEIFLVCNVGLRVSKVSSVNSDCFRGNTFEVELF